MREIVGPQSPDPKAATPETEALRQQIHRIPWHLVISRDILGGNRLTLWECSDRILPADLEQISLWSAETLDYFLDEIYTRIPPAL